MATILGVAIPFFAILLCGMAAARLRLLDGAGLMGLNTFVFWFALPALLFHKVATTAIERLTDVHDRRGLSAFQYEFQDTWIRTQHMWRPSPLFLPCSPDGKLRIRRDGKPLGCPFSIRYSEFDGDKALHAWKDDWTAAIRNDNRIRRLEATMEPRHLLAIAEWQQVFRDYFSIRMKAQKRRVRGRRDMLRQICGS